MTKQEIYKQVLREYDKEKTIAENKYKKRIADVYKIIPEVKEIDDKITKINIDFAKQTLKKNNSKTIEDLKLENSKLLEEREKILNEHGIKKSFLEDVYKCSICKDTGYVHDKECACLKKRIIEKSYDMSNIKSNLEFENFKNFDMSFYSDEIVEKMGISPKKQMEFILSKVKNFIENFDKHFGNLLLYGKTGLGKTFICNCIAKEILDKGKSVLYLTSTQLFKMLEKSTFGKDNDDFDEILKLIFDADLLIIDDLGTEFQTFFTETEFFNIINLRILKKKSVIISTNLSIKDIRDNYSDRIFSRFFGSYDFLEFLGEDIRILKLTRG